MPISTRCLDSIDCKHPPRTPSLLIHRSSSYRHLNLEGGGQMTKSDRKKHVDAWRRSGLGQEDYCKKNSLIISTFRNWVRDYVHLVEPAGRQVVSAASPQMIPVRVTESRPNASGPIELRSPSGFTWSLGSGHSPEWMAELIRRIG